MRPCTIERASDAPDALRRFGGPGAGQGTPAYLAGGTSVVDQMKLDILAADRLVNILPLKRDHAAIRTGDEGVSIGALATMRDVGDHAGIAERFTALVDAVRQAASPQIRNVATIGGNLLQRTRCSYFRDRHAACNKREPGVGCAALGGVTRDLAVLGTSQHCIANYPGDLAVALVAFDATLTKVGLDGSEHTLFVEDLHLLPGDRPDRETALAHGDLITNVWVPQGSWDRSLYLKVRDRASYAFAVVSVALAVRLEDRRVADVRIVLGGLAAKPWRCRSAEAVLRGRRLDRSSVEAAATSCLEGADSDAERAFKVELGRRAVVRALLSADGLPSKG